MRPIVIYNPASGGGKVGKKFQAEYLPVLQTVDSFDGIDLFESPSIEATIDKVKKIHEEGTHDLIISVGGDGVISSICNGLMEIDIKKRLPIMPVPAGSGNSVLREFGILTVQDAVDRFNNSGPDDFDLFKVTQVKSGKSWFCINMIGMGFISDIATKTVEMGKKWGAFSYVLATFSALGEYRPYKTKITYNNGKDEFVSDKVYLLSVSNTKYAGGKIQVAPGASYKDGLLDVVILHDLNRLQFLNGFRKTFKGGHLQDKGCLHFTTDSLYIESSPDFLLMPDGELSGMSPIKIEIFKKQIKMIV